MHNYHPSYMFNAPEVTNEYNMLNDFLSNSLIDDGAMFAQEDGQNYFGDTAMAPPSQGNQQYQIHAHQGQLGHSTAAPGTSISRPASAMPTDKAGEYYLIAADPSGNDAPEERMNKLLNAKYKAGLLKPFNYVKGYARLNEYMTQNMHVSSRRKIIGQLEKFRPKFRERMEKLTDMELLKVEMWFERGLMEYDRVFASMAIPACCWRRTGEIFRGNKEMAELIHQPIDKLRDVSIRTHKVRSTFR
jgi:hypothetical protein